MMTSMTSDGEDAFRSRSRKDAPPATRASCPSKNTCTSGFSAGMTSRKIKRTGSAGCGEKTISSGESTDHHQRAAEVRATGMGNRHADAEIGGYVEARGPARSLRSSHPEAVCRPGIAAASSVMACSGRRIFRPKWTIRGLLYPKGLFHTYIYEESGTVDNPRHHQITM